MDSPVWNASLVTPIYEEHEYVEKIARHKSTNQSSGDEELSVVVSLDDLPSCGVVENNAVPPSNNNMKQSPLCERQNSDIGMISSSSSTNTSVMSNEKFAKLQNLEALYQQGFLLETEYNERRLQLIDEMTGTSVSDTTSSKVPRSLRRKNRAPSSIVVPRAPPDFSSIHSERAIKHLFDLNTRTWQTENVIVRLDDTPFARGGLRLVYHLQEEGWDEYNIVDNNELLLHQTIVNVEDFSPEMGTIKSDTKQPKRRSFVAKIAIDPSEDPSTYFRDVEMQAHCAEYAHLFNSYNPPRRVEFCKAWILELIERENQPLCAVERFVAGDYRKHNNNFGYVSEDERNTPQAFSHFTYEASVHTMLVVDIQGVSDMYTDPQIHTLNGTDFGKGNLGKKGFGRFLHTHRCNRICQYLKLPSVNPKFNTDGTIPNLPYMPATKINKGAFKESHYFEDTPGLQKYLVSGKLRKRKKVREEDHNEWWTTSEDIDDAFCPCVIS